MESSSQPSEAKHADDAAPAAQPAPEEPSVEPATSSVVLADVLMADSSSPMGITPAQLATQPAEICHVLSACLHHSTAQLYYNGDLPHACIRPDPSNPIVA